MKPLKLTIFPEGLKDILIQNWLIDNNFSQKGYLIKNLGVSYFIKK